MELTKEAINALDHPASGQKLYWFDTPRGFGLRATPTAKTFIFDGRVNGKKRRVTIGRVDLFKPLSKAKDVAVEHAYNFNRGVDPVLERAKKDTARKLQEAQTITLAEALKDYADAPKKKGSGYGSGVKLKKARTIRDIHTVCQRHFSDWMGIAVTEITGDMVRDRHAMFAADAPTQANLAFRYLRAALNHVNVDSDDAAPIIVNNPVDRLRKRGQWADTKVKKTRLEREDIPHWVEAVKTLLTDKELTPLKFGAEHRDGLIFILLTGARLSEVFGNKEDGYPALAWTDVDMKRGTVTFRDTKNRDDHQLPLGPKLLGILEARKEVSGLYVFGNANNEVSGDLRSAFTRIEAMVGLRVTAHDLRRTFAAVANSLDISGYKLKRLLNHISGNTSDVTAGYIGDITTDDLREPMQRIEEFMLREVQELPA
ncbi:tyrosine-type recombinase/integrase [Pseudorhodobacter turbinis]|nr:integrase family protein [Pseudorhodobacter turbinis]